MSGFLLSAARKDAQRIITGGGFEEDITVSNPNRTISATIKGTHSKHWISFDTDGNQVNSKNAHITIVESDLTDNGFTVRNQNTGNVDLRKYIIEVKDSTDIIKKYVINETFPSETFGLIVCVLGDLK